MELFEALTQTFDHTTKVMAGVRNDQLDSPTPCRDWDLRALLQHTIGVVANMGSRAAGGDFIDPTTYPLEKDLGAQFRSVADGTLAAWKARGLDGMIDIGAGEMPTQIACSINVADTATHSWDIARATGQDANLPDALAEVVLAGSQGFLTDEVRQFAGFDAAIAVGADASATDRLVAFLGRQP